MDALSDVVAPWLAWLGIFLNFFGLVLAGCAVYGEKRDPTKPVFWRPVLENQVMGVQDDPSAEGSIP